MSTGRKILIVDDDKRIQEFVNLALRHEGYEILSASDGVIGLNLIQTHHPDLILLDLRMPNMDGRTFLENYRQLPIDHAPVIVFTAGRQNEAPDGINADGYLPKPFNLDELIDLVHRYTAE